MIFILLTQYQFSYKLQLRDNNMLANLCVILRMTARRLKTSANAQPKPQPSENVKFSEEELTRMGMFGKQKLKLDDAYKMKFQRNQQEESPSIKYEKKVKVKSQKEFYNRPFYKHLDKEERINPQNTSLKNLASVRLSPQFLPPVYLKKVQKIFHKYSQQHLREIADNFSKLVRLRYTQEKINYEEHENLKFQRLQDKLPKQKQVQQIYLIGKDKAYDEKERPEERKVDADPFNPEMSYTQNIAVSYLLNRVPRTFSTAIRLMTEIMYKYPSFKPKSFLDFGSGLSSGSLAFIDIYEDTGQVYNVEPAGKMRKLSKYLTQNFQISHYQTLGQLSQTVKQVDIVYAGYVINELKPDLVEVYLQALYAKVKSEGFLVVAEYGNPFGARIIHEVRKWAIKKKMYIAAPCPHHDQCPLAKDKVWCHFDQPSGMYPSQVFGKLPTDQDIKLEKYSYLILQKKEQEEEQQFYKSQKIEPNITKDWDRVIFPVMKRGKHTVFNLCTKSGNYERRISAKSHGQEYKESKKLKWGDYWRFGKRIPNKFRKQRHLGKRLW